MDQNDEVVSLFGTAGITSHFVVVWADQGPVDGADREGQQLLLAWWCVSAAAVAVDCQATAKA